MQFALHVAANMELMGFVPLVLPFPRRRLRRDRGLPTGNPSGGVIRAVPEKCGRYWERASARPRSRGSATLPISYTLSEFAPTFCMLPKWGIADEVSFARHRRTGLWACGGAGERGEWGR